ncbi:formate/nitrite transporter Fnt [Butyrivibrio proteoclasticus B316]|uniref:Formate/nitrite transporter Fnt n=1 Tax=Butyrivibrio proteoclasticus (strain ATCC 51982 / DSM 14932 / B316) TaxID=515622 RepID=E0RY03_BUTPB|nr:formate/nitrite transporter family protein [Butyrivibrio proteoclasticus]ADL34958.1 formate/nitrite transporter Fnt [Butyrivibrio proteoclasticus B316]
MKSPAEIAVKYESIGKGKTELSALKTFLLGILAGAYIALGGLGSQIASCTAADPSSARLISSVVFPIGLFMVLVGGAELFTGNCLIFIPVLSGKAKFTGMLRNWVLVYLGNMVGGFLIALLAATSHIYSFANNALAEGVINTAITKANISFSDGLLRGILCNVLVCLAVWCSFSADEVAGKVLALWLPVMLFIICGFEHCVANMYFIPAGMLTSAIYGLPAEGLSLFGFFVTNLIPVTIGNIIGGSICVGAMYYAIYLKK